MDDKTIFYFVVIIVTVFITWQYMSNANKIAQVEQHISDSQQNGSCPVCQTCQVCPICSGKSSKSETSGMSNSQINKSNDKFESSTVNIDIIQDHSIPPVGALGPLGPIGSVPITPPMIPPNPLREYDYRTLNDPLVPPLKRDDFSGFLPTVYTRGFPSGYKKIGLLIDQNAQNDDKYKFMILVGRLRYPRGTVYDYFVTENKHDSALKFDLPNLTKELYTDDEVTIPDLGKTYKLKADRNLGFDYSPFMY